MRELHELSRRVPRSRKPRGVRVLKIQENLFEYCLARHSDFLTRNLNRDLGAYDFAARPWTALLGVDAFGVVRRLVKLQLKPSDEGCNAMPGIGPDVFSDAAIKLAVRKYTPGGIVRVGKFHVDGRSRGDGIDDFGRNYPGLILWSIGVDGMEVEAWERESGHIHLGWQVVPITRGSRGGTENGDQGSTANGVARAGDGTGTNQSDVHSVDQAPGTGRTSTRSDHHRISRTSESGVQLSGAGQQESGRPGLHGEEQGRDHGDQQSERRGAVSQSPFASRLLREAREREARRHAQAGGLPRSLDMGSMRAAMARDAARNNEVAAAQRNWERWAELQTEQIPHDELMHEIHDDVERIGEFYRTNTPLDGHDARTSLTLRNRARRQAQEALIQRVRDRIIEEQRATRRRHEERPRVASTVDFNHPEFVQRDGLDGMRLEGELPEAVAPIPEGNLPAVIGQEPLPEDPGTLPENVEVVRGEEGRYPDEVRRQFTGNDWALQLAQFMNDGPLTTGMEIPDEVRETLNWLQQEVREALTPDRHEEPTPTPRPRRRARTSSADTRPPRRRRLAPRQVVHVDLANPGEEVTVVAVDTETTAVDPVPVRSRSRGAGVDSMAHLWNTLGTRTSEGGDE